MVACVPHLDPALADAASAHRGAFDSRIASRLGVTTLDLHRLVRAGAVTRVRRGAFVVTAALAGLSPEEDYALRTRAVLLSRPSPSWASHHCALAVSDLPLPGIAKTTFDVCARVRRESRSGSVVTRPLPDGEHCLSVAGVRCVSTESALVQVAAREGVKAAIAAADAALRRGLVTAAGLADATERLGLGVREQAKVSALLTSVDAAAESPGESLLRLVLLALGFDFRSQAVVQDPQGRFVARVDFLVGERVVVEFDGAVKYDGVDGREALAREKRREDRLRALGYEVVRLTWADLDRQDLIARMIREALARVRARGL